MRPIQLVFISTNAITRSGIAHLLSRSKQPIEVVAAFANFEAAGEYMRTALVDVVLIDEALPRGVNLLQEVKAIRHRCVGVSVVVILQRPTMSIVQQLLALGARGILHKQDDLEWHLVQSIILGRQRGVHLSPGASHFVDTQRKLPASLCPRDIDVLRLLADGLEPKELAPHIGVTKHTVYRILRVLRVIFNAQSNTQLVLLAQQMKLLEQDEHGESPDGNT